ncbi:chromogranin-A isoform X1 [Scleropages formosus]|uniref:Chromogranin-A n=2 Tax=Scleropages formosus TaxID=113540 RepID=A0A8C9S254_SCLFO|nr:chromogranin-A isoform X1 [Scleropages formosus]
MLSRGCLVLTILVSSALSHPVPSERPDEEEDSQLMKCIVEVLADTLTKPHHAEISQECLDVLSGDERIASILNHQNLLRELHEVAVQGSSDRAHHSLQSGGKVEHSHLTKKPGSHPESNTTAGEPMLETSGQQTVGMTGNTLVGTSRLDQEKQEGEVDSEKDSKEDYREGKPLVVDANIHFDKKEAKENNHLNDSEEKEYGTHVYKGSEAGPGMQDTEKSAEGEEEPGEKQGGEIVGEKSEEEEELRAGEKDLQSRKNKDVHSKDTEVQRRPEAQGRHLVTQDESEEGSASSRPEDNEIERLAAIESELGNLAWRLHQLRRS